MACLLVCGLACLWACGPLLLDAIHRSDGIDSLDWPSLNFAPPAGQVVVDLFSSVIKPWRLGKANSGAAPTRTTRKKKENEMDRNQKLAVCVCVPAPTHRRSSRCRSARLLRRDKTVTK